jgi:hypothetical protein
MSLILGVLAFIAGLVALVATCHLLVNLARDYAEDRRREQEYADAWCRTHLKHQHDRHDHGDERKPE